MRYKGSMRSGGALVWFYQRLSGLVLIVLLLVHFAVLHSGPGGRVTYEAVAARLVTPFWKTFNLLFLVLAVFHGFNGLLMVIRDYVLTGWKRSALYSLVVVAGAVSLILGWLTIAPFQVRLP